MLRKRYTNIAKMCYDKVTFTMHFIIQFIIVTSKPDATYLIREQNSL